MNIKYMPLHNAAMRGDLSTVRHLLSAGANPNARDRTGMTPLAYALMHRHHRIVLMLRKYGAQEEGASS